MSQPVYLVTAGNYSEYHVIAVSLSKSDADAIAIGWNQSRGDYAHHSCEAIVEEWTLGADGFAPGRRLFQICVYRDKGPDDFYVHDDALIYDYSTNERPDEDPRQRSLWIWATDEQHARKIATERWAQWKAARP